MGKDCQQDSDGERALNLVALASACSSGIVIIHISLVLEWGSDERSPGGGPALGAEREMWSHNVDAIQHSFRNIPR